MKKKEFKKNLTLDIFGSILITYSLFSIFVSIYLNRYYEIFWLCYICSFLIGIGTLTRSGKLILSQTNILLIPDIFWNIDFFTHLITKVSPLKIIDYYFIEQSMLANIVSWQHIFVVPIGLISLYFIKTKTKDSWKISLTQIIIIFILTYLLTPTVQNVNCVFDYCVKLRLPIPYQLIWFIVFFLLVYLTNLFLTNIKIFVKNKN